MFKDEIMELLEEKKPEDIELREVEVNKANEGLLHGVVFFSEEHDGGPSFYFEYMEEMHKNGVSLEDIADHIVKIADEAFEHITINIDELTCGSNVVLMLVDEKSNEGFFEDKPSMTAGDGYRFIAKVNNENFAAVITNDILDGLGWDAEMMFDCGISNMLHHVFLFDMGKTIFDMGKTIVNQWSKEKLVPAPYILTVETVEYGSACLFLPGVADALMEKLGQGFYAIPSTLDEFVIMPKSIVDNMGALHAMCANIQKFPVGGKTAPSDRISVFDKEGE